MESERRSYQILSGSSLKLIAIVSMLSDHLCKCLLRPAGLLDPLYFDIFSQWIGRLAFPIYAFLLVEGFLHTRNLKRYLISIAILAVISQIPWNLVHGSIWYLEKLNTIFALLLGLLSIIALDRIKGWKSYACIFAALAIAQIFHVDYSYKGVLAIILTYLLRGNHIHQFLGIFASMFRDRPTVGLIFAWIPLVMYNGKRGFIKGHFLKYAFYAFYPVHLFIIWLIGKSIGL